MYYKYLNDKKHNIFTPQSANRGVQTWNKPTSTAFPLEESQHRLLNMTRFLQWYFHLQKETSNKSICITGLCRTYLQCLECAKVPKHNKITKMYSSL